MLTEGVVGTVFSMVTSAVDMTLEPSLSVPVAVHVSTSPGSVSSASMVYSEFILSTAPAVSLQKKVTLPSGRVPSLISSKEAEQLRSEPVVINTD